MLNLFEELHASLIKTIKGLTVVIETTEKLVLESEVVGTECWRDLSESSHKIIHTNFMLNKLLLLLILLFVNLQFILDAFAIFGITSKIDISEKCETGCTSDDGFNLCTSIVDCVLSQEVEIDIGFKETVLSHTLGMNLEDLLSTIFIWQSNFKMNFHTSWSQNGWVDHIFSICHTNNQDIVQTFYTIHFSE